MDAQMTRSVSSCDSSPRSNALTAARAPTGNPQNMPSSMAQHPSGGSRNSRDSGSATGRSRILPMPPETISSDRTRKGKSDGITVRAQSRSPAVMYSIATSGLRRMSSRQNSAKKPKQSCPGVGPACRAAVGSALVMVGSSHA